MDRKVSFAFFPFFFFVFTFFAFGIRFALLKHVYIHVVERVSSVSRWGCLDGERVVAGVLQRPNERAMRAEAFAHPAWHIYLAYFAYFAYRSGRASRHGRTKYPFLFLCHGRYSGSVVAYKDTSFFLSFLSIIYCLHTLGFHVMRRRREREGLDIILSYDTGVGSAYIYVEWKMG